MSKSYVIVAPAALVNVEGSYAALMQHGAVLPDGVDPVQLQHLIDTGIVVEGAPVGGLAPLVVVEKGRAVPVPFTEPDADAEKKAAEEADAKAKADKAAADDKAKAEQKPGA